ncbi:hypothetical protein [Ferrithrix thermotolerans]|uniref:hypothetical protein n=1 Tax=Ferrithrix thermotolerans TaxID=209649 RepID=UPI000933D6B1|nr:hypothetical protein [Ferrithrix thermotolerans]
MWVVGDQGRYDIDRGAVLRVDMRNFDACLPDRNSDLATSSLTVTNDLDAKGFQRNDNKLYLGLKRSRLQRCCVGL